MGKWVTILQMQDFTDTYLIKSTLEFEDIEVQLLDELSFQTASHLTHAGGGIRIQVHEENLEKAREILIEKGYMKRQEVVKPNILFALSSKIPIIKEMDPLKGTMVLVIIISIIIISIITYLN